MMSYKLPMREQQKSKWMTVALVFIYVIVGLFIAMKN